MEINETDYILGVWHGEGKNRNVLITLKKSSDGWIGEARLREIKDDKIFESDTKGFWTLNITDRTEEEVITDIQELMERMKRESFIDTYEFIEIKGNGEKFLFKIAQEPWAHIERNENAEGYRRNYQDTNG
jgi:hypothetical protein